MDHGGRLSDTMSNGISVRIVVVNPPAGVTMAVQRGRRELIPPVTRSQAEAVFDLTLRVGRPRADGRPNLLGDVAQGTADGRFV